MANAPVRPYLGETATERVEARRRRLLEAAMELMAGDGWRQMRIDGLCQAAKLNKRYFYESFEDLDQLAAAVVDDLVTGLLDAALTAVDEARERQLPNEEMTRAVLGAAVSYLTDDPRRARILFTEVAANKQAIAHRRATIRTLAGALSAYGHEHHEATGTDPIAELASALLIGGSAEVVVAWLDGEVEMSKEQLVDDLAALWVLAGDGAAARAKARHGA